MPLTLPTAVKKKTGQNVKKTKKHQDHKCQNPMGQIKTDHIKMSNVQ